MLFLRSHFVKKKVGCSTTSARVPPASGGAFQSRMTCVNARFFSSDRDLLLQAWSIRGSKRTLLEHKTRVNYARKADTGQYTRFVQQL